MGILVSIGTTILLRTLEAQKADATLLEMEVLRRAIIGDKSVIISGRRSDFGYYGDMGVMPSSLTELLDKGSQPALTQNSKYNISFGWGGPYLSKSFQDNPNDMLEDGWRNSYNYSNTKTVNAAGDTVLGELTSLGADGVVGGTGFDADIDLEILQNEATATVYGSAYTLDGNPMVAGKVYLFKPNGTSSLVADSVTTGVDGTYSFSRVPRGTRAVSFLPFGATETGIITISVSQGTVNIPRVSSIKAGLILVSGSAFVTGGGNERVQFNLNNLLGQTVQITDYKAFYPGNYNPTTGPKYDRLEVGKVRVFDEKNWNNLAGSGDRLDSKGSGMTNFNLIDSKSTTIKMRKFEDDNGNSVDMAGTSFTITLYTTNGNEYIFNFTP